MRPHRICFVGGIYHVTTRCNNREFSFQNDEDFQSFLEIMEKAKKRYCVNVHNYCLTNNHVHILVGTPVIPTLSNFMQYLNGNFARDYNKRHGKTGHFWGERFHSNIIESETQFFLCAAYIESNMVRCGVVDKPENWKWSSFHAYAYGKQNTIIDFHELYIKLANSYRERQEIYRKMSYNYQQERTICKRPIFSSTVILGSKDFVDSILSNHANSSYYNNHAPYEIRKNLFTIKKNYIREKF